MGITTIFFDLDGTLTDPGLGITNSILYALEQMGRPIPPRERLYPWIGPPLQESFQAYAEMTEEEARQAVSWFRVYFDRQGKFENVVYPGIPKLLATLQWQGIRLAVATSKPEQFALEILAHFDLAPYFTGVFGSAMDGNRRRKGEVLAYALESLRIRPEEALMVGDREHDVQGARENGMTCVGILYGYGYRVELESAGSFHLAETVEELEEVLLQIKEEMR